MVADTPPISSIETGEFQKLIGYEITDWGPGFAVIELELKDEHCNRHGNPHGGVLMTLLDAACTRAGTVGPETHEIGRAATISVSTNFIVWRRAASCGSRARRPEAAVVFFSPRPMPMTKKATLSPRQSVRADMPRIQNNQLACG